MKNLVLLLAISLGCSYVSPPQKKITRFGLGGEETELVIQDAIKAGATLPVPVDKRKPRP